MPGDGQSPRSSKPFSLSLGSGKPRASPTSQKPLTLSNGVKRGHASLRDWDDDGEHDGENGGRAEAVESFDSAAGGAISTDGPEQKKQALIIPKQNNRDWRMESMRKRGKNLLPQEVQQQQAAAAPGDQNGADVVNGDGPSYGLTFASKSDSIAQTSHDGLPGEEQEKPLTEDELAIEALKGKSDSRKSKLVLPAEEERQGSSRGEQVGVNEDEAFKMDVESRPESASLDQYAAVPVEEFGAALLRGMGWKEGEIVGKRKDQMSKPRALERRPALLGIGAKEVGPEDKEALGGWGKAIKGRRKPDQTYNPVLMKNPKTGEMMSEEELKKRVEDSGREGHESGKEDDWRDRRDRNLQRDRDRKESRREKKDEDYESHRDISCDKRDGRRDRNKDRHRRERDDESRDRTRHRRDRSKERDRQRGNEGDYRSRSSRETSARSPKYDERDRERHRHRDRTRD